MLAQTFLGPYLFFRDMQLDSFLPSGHPQRSPKFNPNTLSFTQHFPYSARTPGYPIPKSGMKKILNSNLNICLTNPEHPLHLQYHQVLQNITSYLFPHQTSIGIDSLASQVASRWWSTVITISLLSPLNLNLFISKVTTRNPQARHGAECSRMFYSCLKALFSILIISNLADSLISLLGTWECAVSPLTAFSPDLSPRV